MPFFYFCDIVSQNFGVVSVKTIGERIVKIQVDLPPKGLLLTKRDYEVDESKLPKLTDLIGLFADSPVDIGGGWNPTQRKSMTPPTESELDKLQSRIDMREEAEATIRWVHPGCDAALRSKHVLTLLDEIEELETTIATQACDIAEYQRLEARMRLIELQGRV